MIKWPEPLAPQEMIWKSPAPVPRPWKWVHYSSRMDFCSPICFKDLWAKTCTHAAVRRKFAPVYTLKREKYKMDVRFQRKWCQNIHLFPPGADVEREFSKVRNRVWGRKTDNTSTVSLFAFLKIECDELSSRWNRYVGKSPGGDYLLLKT